MNSLVSRMDRLLPRSLQVKLILLVTGLLLLLVGLIGALFSDSVENLLRVQIGRKAVEVARSVALNPAIREGLRTGTSRDVQIVAEAIRKATGAEFVVIGDTRGIRLSHPDPKKIGEHFVGGDIDPALKEGKSYASESVGTLGPSLRGIVPVRDDREEVIGFAAVGYLLQDIEVVVREQQWEIVRYAAVVVLFGIFGATLIARGLKSVIFGLEPQEIAALFQERNAVIGAIREGIISVDGEGRLTLVNLAARRYLGESPSADLRGRRLTEVCPCADLERSLGEGDPLFDQEMTVAGRTMVVNLLPFGAAAGAGAVASFRPKDELDRLTRQLSQMQEYSELLRAQTHEYTNKLHTIAGLIQIGAHQEALDLVMTESSGYQELIRTLAEAVPDPVVAGVILGKFNRARELKIDFIFDRQSSLTDLPEHLDRNHLLTILGNLLDNAFDAVRDAPRREVRLFLTDLGPDLLFEVEDSGEGVSPQIVSTLFEKGVTTKEETGRGIGLFLVRRALDALQGEITVGRGEIGGALFTAIIPKGGRKEIKAQPAR